MKRAIKIKQNQRRRQQRDGWKLDKSSSSRKQENDKPSFCCNQQDDNTDYVSDFRNHISPKMVRETEW